MRQAILAAVIALGAESTALACSCLPPLNAADERASADRIANGAVALVEVDVLSPYDRRRRRGELMRVRNVLAGRSTPTFRLSRLRAPDSAGMCDNIYQMGERTIVVLYPAMPQRRRRGNYYREGGVCTTALAKSFPVLRQYLVRAINRRTRQSH